MSELPKLNVYGAVDGQPEDVHICGTKEGLLALRSVIDRALNGQPWTQDHNAQDNSGKTYRVRADLNTLEGMITPQTWHRMKSKKS